MSSPGRPRRLLLIGGGGGLVGRAVLNRFAPDHRIRSIHRHPVHREISGGVEWIRANVADYEDWEEAVREVDLIINVAWHRSGSDRRFRALRAGLERMLAAAAAAKVPKILQVSVPPAPAHLEEGLPYLVHKRRFDHAVQSSGIPYTIVRPTLLFGPGDVLLGVMLRMVARYPFFPMFGDGGFHLSPLAAADLARILRMHATVPESSILLAGGPTRYRYRELCDLIFHLVGKKERYWNLSGRGAVRLARLLESVGGDLLYAYEVEWLLSDMLGLPPFEGLNRPLERVEPFLSAEAARRRGPGRLLPPRAAPPDA